MLRALLLATTGLCSATIANAATMDFVNTHRGPLVAPTQFDGSFDLNDFVQDSLDDGFGIQMNAATVSLVGYSASNNSFTRVRTGSFTYYVAQTGYSSYDCGFAGWSTCYRAYTYYVSRTGSTYTQTSGDVEPDVVTVDFGDTELSGNTNGPTQYSGNFYGTSSRTIYRTSADYGTETDSSPLLPSDFGMLLNDNVLDYSLIVSQGEYDNVQVKLSLDYDRVALPPAVPLPASMLLLGGGVAALGAVRRSKKKTRAAA